MLTIWGRTRGNLQVKGVAALNAMPLWLVTVNPAVQSIKDFTDKDKIALPTVKSSIQAITLQMAAPRRPTAPASRAGSIPSPSPWAIPTPRRRCSAAAPRSPRISAPPRSRRWS